MKQRKSRYFVSDFETTVYEGQDSTEVWASASVELFTEDVHIFHSIGEQLEYFYSLDSNLVVYFHNLKFDGSFWLSYLMKDLGYKQAYKQGKDPNDFEFLPDKEMPNNTFKYSISDMGQWYTIVIKHKNRIIEIRDSLKLLPFKVKTIGENFKTKHRKLEMEYTGFRYAGCTITEEEKHYIANDVLVVKEALEIMFTEGHNKLTIGSCCLAEYKKIVGKSNYEMMFPDMYEWPMPPGFDCKTAGDWIHATYRGAWCYLAKGKEKQVFPYGVTADVNSLYPSVMSGESGNRYPIGEPRFWQGDYIPDEALDPAHYFFIKIRTRFYLKPGYLPTIQIKNNLMYRGTEMLETSDVLNEADGKYYRTSRTLDGKEFDNIVTLSLTMTDYNLIKEHYYLEDTEIIEGCWFRTAVGIFDGYIDKYKRIKIAEKGAKRQLAKLFLNNLYGKMASSKRSSFKVAYLKEDGAVGFRTIVAYDKKPGYIPVGSAITAYARDFTIRAAQKNYASFIYADTDSIHCNTTAALLKGITVHPTDFCCWKVESTWDLGFFVRQKTYIEHVIEEDLQPIDAPYYNVKCAGMPEKCKNLFIESVKGYEVDETDKYTEKEREWLSTKREITDFNVGLAVPGKLLPKRITGGVLLVDTEYQMR